MRALIDACVFAQKAKWLFPLVSAAEKSYTDLLWSPSIIAEANRLLTWLWARETLARGQSLNNASWRELSESAHRMFARLSLVFEVVEDAPPNELMWTDTPPDAWDIPLWNAAVRGEADFIVTENLNDGPPPDSSGIRRFHGVLYVHPDRFLEFVEYFAERVTASFIPSLEGDAGERVPLPSLADPNSPREELTVLHPALEEYLQWVQRQD